MTKSISSNRLPLSLTLAGFVLLVAAAFAITSRPGSAEEEAEPTPSPTLEPSPTPSPTPFVPVVEDSPPPAPWDTFEAPKHISPPIGPIDAEPVEVHTGDGDCLNVRWVPGTLFASEPLFCAPEGTVLWLFGDPREADGETWRYALGAGWLVERFTRPTTPAVIAQARQSVLFSDALGQELQVARLGFQLEPLFEGRFFLLAGGGFEGSAAGFSPDGRFLAGLAPEGWPNITIADLHTGESWDIPQSASLRWSPDGRLLLQHDVDCDFDCHSTLSLYDPVTRELEPLLPPGPGFYTVGFAPNGTLYALDYADERRRLVRIEGGGMVPVFELPADTWYSEVTVSPDGTRVALVSDLQPIRVVDLTTGAVTVLDRAPQRVLDGGRCGGGSVRSAAWLDDSTLVYHESFALNGHNGLTLVDAETGARSVLPITAFDNLQVLGDGLLALSTPVSMDTADGEYFYFHLTWLVEPSTGAMSPFAVGRGLLLE